MKDERKQSPGTVGEAFAREDDVDEMACFCAMRHINALLRQSHYKRTADWAEPCQGCPRHENDECNVDWLWNIMPIAKMGKLKPNLSPEGYEQKGDKRCLGKSKK